MASALKGMPESRSGSLQAGSRENMISFICFRWIGISEGPEGKNPLFLTMSVRIQKQYVIKKNFYYLAECTSKNRKQMQEFKYIQQELLDLLLKGKTLVQLSTRTLWSLHELQVWHDVHNPVRNFSITLHCPKNTFYSTRFYSTSSII